MGCMGVDGSEIYVVYWGNIKIFPLQVANPRLDGLDRVDYGVGWVGLRGWIARLDNELAGLRGLFKIGSAGGGDDPSGGQWRR
jgi:hypothetical protein